MHSNRRALPGDGFGDGFGPFEGLDSGRFHAYFRAYNMVRAPLPWQRVIAMGASLHPFLWQWGRSLGLMLTSCYSEMLSVQKTRVRSNPDS